MPSERWSTAGGPVSAQRRACFVNPRVANGPRVQDPEGIGGSRGAARPWTAAAADLGSDPYEAPASDPSRGLCGKLRRHNLSPNMKLYRYL
ncbi:hypothetical protein EYF80_014884 [Liparis tanakae]|uniref:Uncharacterized protein n=1 Tax=Liparis tanakae TaxID=230148 RepID=A0A4Z2IBQ8_9TELE|nr:hypothetical protein EYF80_014884 [Liparis tanakae]